MHVRKLCVTFRKSARFHALLLLLTRRARAREPASIFVVDSVLAGREVLCLLHLSLSLRGHHHSSFRVGKGCSIRESVPPTRCSTISVLPAFKRIGRGRVSAGAFLD